MSGFDDTAVEVEAIDNERLAWLECNDLGNAHRLKARFGGTLCFMPHSGWAAFDGRHWSVADGARRAGLAAHETVRALRDEAEALTALLDSPARRAKAEDAGLSAEMVAAKIASLNKFRTTAGNSNRLAGMLREAAHLMTVPDDAFDRDRMALNVMNGTLRFVGEVLEGAVRIVLDPHDAGDRISKLAAVAYDPDARCPKWLAHLELCLPDASARRFFAQAMGYSMTGVTGEQCIFICQGKGGDGKSTAVNVIRTLLGSYAAAGDVKTFLSAGGRASSGPSSDLVRLRGDVRMVSLSEPPKNSTLDDGRIKGFTGGSPITARGMRQDDIEFTPRGKIWLECNTRPKVGGDDDGIWRRLLMLLWPSQIEKTAGVDIKDYHLILLAEEASGILNWALAGLVDWLHHGRLVRPAIVTDPVNDYRRASSHLSEWFGECTIAEAGVRTRSKDLGESYTNWCADNGIGDKEKLSSTALGLAMGERQHLTKKDGNGNIWRMGIRLKSDFERRRDAPAADGAVARDASGAVAGGDIDWGDAPAGDDE